jgi:hypothetical protein
MIFPSYFKADVCDECPDPGLCAAEGCLADLPPYDDPDIMFDDPDAEAIEVWMREVSS